MTNSVRGMVAGGGSNMNFAYIPTTGGIAVGRPDENIVTLV